MNVFSIKTMIISSFFFFLLLTACGDDSGNGNTNPTLPTISINPISKFEGDDQTSFEFKLRLSQVSDSAVSVDFSTVGGTAGAEDDFISQAGTLTFLSGEQDKSIFIEIVTDIIREQDEEFKVVLSNPQNATLNTVEAIGTIRNDDTFVDVPEDGYITPEEYTGWTKIWADEFEGTQINSSNWTHELGDHGWGNNELQNYTNSSENSYVSDGKLFIEAKKVGSGYTSARMITANKFDFVHGRVDIRAQLPKGQGVWPALWMLGANFFDIGWPQCGEIDIMEIVGHEPDNLHGTIHWDQNGHASFGGSTKLSDGDFSDEFHVFTIIWDNQDIEWYLDDLQYHNADVSPAALSEFHKNFFFIFNVAVGGNWPGSPDGSTVFPQQMIVDYIRVFQQ